MKFQIGDIVQVVDNSLSQRMVAIGTQAEIDSITEIGYVLNINGKRCPYLWSEKQLDAGFRCRCRIIRRKYGIKT